MKFLYLNFNIILIQTLILEMYINTLNYCAWRFIFIKYFICWFLASITKYIVSWMIIAYAFVE